MSNTAQTTEPSQDFDQASADPYAEYDAYIEYEKAYITEVQEVIAKYKSDIEQVEESRKLLADSEGHTVASSILADELELLKSELMALEEHYNDYNVGVEKTEQTLGRARELEILPNTYKDVMALISISETASPFSISRFTEEELIAIQDELTSMIEAGNGFNPAEDSALHEFSEALAGMNNEQASFFMEMIKSNLEQKITFVQGMKKLQDHFPEGVSIMAALGGIVPEEQPEPAGAN